MLPASGGRASKRRGSLVCTIRPAAVSDELPSGSLATGTVPVARLAASRLVNAEPLPANGCPLAKEIMPVLPLTDIPPMATLPPPTVMGESISVKLEEIAGTWLGVALERKMIWYRTGPSSFFAVGETRRQGPASRSEADWT